MSKQTAVEWLLEQCPRINAVASLDVIEQALELEKEQIVDAWMATDNELQRLAAEKYYNETYEGGQDV